MIRVLIHLMLIFNLLIAIASAVMLTTGISGSPWPPASVLGALACLCGAAVAGILVYGLHHDRAQPSSGRTTIAVGARPLPTVAELESLRATVQSAFDMEKARYSVTLENWRTYKEDHSAERKEARQAAYKNYASARERMMTAREEVIFVIKQLRRAEARLTATAPETSGRSRKATAAA